MYHQGSFLLSSHSSVHLPERKLRSFPPNLNLQLIFGPPRLHFQFRSSHTIDFHRPKTEPGLLKYLAGYRLIINQARSILAVYFPFHRFQVQSLNPQSLAQDASQGHLPKYSKRPDLFPVIAESETRSENRSARKLPY